jgi:dihydrofolate synthase / folylpolyglutamate synthase
MSSGTWTPNDAERYLGSLELFGMRFGLDRILRLLTVLGTPQDTFESIHVVGSNGKSSTVRMVAALLRAHGRRAGAYLSPHLVGYEERVEVDGRPLDREAFAAAVERTAKAAALVDRTAAADDRVTQFEALTAAALSELARSDVEVAVVEAGLGGRYDATNVLPSRVQVLTSVGLEHTRWLGPTIRDIAREKLAVVRDGGTLVVGADLHPEAREEAEAAAARHGARLVTARPGAPLGLPAYQERNFALARAAAEAYLGTLDPVAVSDAARVAVPGRLQVIDERPRVILDGAHNTEGMAALVESLPDVVPTGAPLVAVVSVLEDKDAAAMLRALLPVCADAVLTGCSNPRALPPATLASLAEQVTGRSFNAARDPRAALERAKGLAGPAGAVLATGSIYLVSDLVRPAGRRAATL